MLYMDINCTRILKIEYCRMNTTCKSKKDDVLPDPAEHQPFFQSFFGAVRSLFFCQQLCQHRVMLQVKYRIW